MFQYQQLQYLFHVNVSQWHLLVYVRRGRNQLLISFNFTFINRFFSFNVL
ncbi:ribose 5-phosphate isomerase B [Listeria monocytogenes]|nr:ribose 5-phosphate isomerase B [Listeria monocytogenes]GAT39357.1 ribose 5-phosphate isomerase B [Listeria monocytogenes]